MPDAPNVFTAVNVHRADRIDATYMTGSGGGEWTDLVIGNLRVTIHGPHAKTASMLVAAAGGCPEPPPVAVVESYEQLRERTLREDRKSPCSDQLRGHHCTLNPGHEGGHNFPVGASPDETPGRSEGIPNLNRARAPMAEDAVREVGA